MIVQPRELLLYKNARGIEPFAVWIRSMKARKTRAVIRAWVNRLEAGNFGNCRRIGSGISEQKIDTGPGYRVYFGLNGGTRIILLCGGTKSTQRRDIARSRRLWKSYLERKG